MSGGIIVAALSMVVMAAPDPDKGPDKLDVSAYPAELRSAYPLFQSKCSKCHSLARPINSNIAGEDWKPYIKKMIRRPASGINEEAGKRIYEFLKYYSTIGKAAPARAPAEGAGPKTPAPGVSQALPASGTGTGRAPPPPGGDASAIAGAPDDDGGTKE